MALLEVIQRRLSRGGTLKKVLMMLPKLPLLLTLASLLLLVNLTITGNYRHTYISENALMPSQANAGFRESEWNIVRGYRNELVNMMNWDQSQRNSELESWLKTMGYKTSYSSFIDEMGVEKHTLYAIYHVPKGDDTEAMVLVSPWLTPDEKLNINGMAITLGLGQYFHRLSIWAKNIILVFPDNGQADLRQWVDAYHTSLDHTGGSLESAIILEHPSTDDNMSHIEIDFAGVNGQLPNLDLVNTAILVANHEGFKISLNHTPHGQLWSDDVFSRIGSLFSGIMDLAGAGSVKWTDTQSMSGWNVQTITIRGVGKGGPDVTVLGRVIESTFRSVNNLLEKFHQSFFFYLILGPQYFVSIASYLPAGCLTAFAFVVSSINSFVGGIFIKKVQGDSLVSNYGLSIKSLAWGFGTVILSIGSCIFYGIYLMQYFHASAAEEVWVDLTYFKFILPLSLINLLPLVSMVIPFQKLLRVSSTDIQNYIRAMTTIVQFYFGYILVAQLVLNFALPYVISLCTIGFCYIRCPSRNDNGIWVNTKFKNTFLLLLTSPVTWLLIFGELNTVGFQLDRIRNFVQYFSYKLLQTEIQSILDFIEVTPKDVWVNGPVGLFKSLVLCYNRVQCWTWIFICLSWLPTWICMCVVASLDIDGVKLHLDDDEKKDK